MNVETGAFEALTERVAELERRIEAATSASAILRNAGLPPGRVAAVEAQERRQKARQHLRVVGA